MADFISLLQCPISGLPLRQLSNKEVVELNQKIDRKEIVHSHGKPSIKTVVEALKVEGKDFYYPVLEGIYCLLPHLVLVGKHESSFQLELEVDEVNAHLHHFYDEVAWQSHDAKPDGAQRLDQPRTPAGEYIRRCQDRVKRLLKPKGQYLLDLARRPSRSDSLAYSADYEYTLFADTSLPALRETKRQVKGKSFFILCDMTHLPFQTGTLDGCVSLHTTLYIPKRDQAKAIAQAYRVLKEESAFIVVYRWGTRSWWMRSLTFPWRLKAKYQKSLNKTSKELSYEAHGYQWFLSEIASRYPVTLKPWCSVHETFLNHYIRRSLFGKWLLKLIFTLEETFPKAMAKMSVYPMMVIVKKKHRLKREAYHV